VRVEKVRHLVGHIHLGRLPKSAKWNRVVELLDEAPFEVDNVALATLDAADMRLERLEGDPSLTYCFWLLTRLTWASREPDFLGSATALGIDAADVESSLDFIAELSDRMQLDLARHRASGPFSEIASLALRRTLTETIGLQGASLFGGSILDVQHAFRQHSTDARFGELAQRFFGNFLNRTLRYFLDRELSNNVGAGHAMAGVDDSRAFTEALEVYCHQSARIMETFAADWYSKHAWQSGGEISREEAQGFVAVAVNKLRTELTVGNV